MARPTKDKQIPHRSAAIKQAAWQQIAKTGAAALSLRAIARDLNITAPAIYNYFSRRDDLVTALIVDAFTSLGESQKEAIDEVPDHNPGMRLSILGFAYRDWALASPQRYQLIFGTPIPNYAAPVEITTQAAAKSIVPLAQTLQACWQTNVRGAQQNAPMSSELRTMLQEWSQFTGGVDIEVLYAALVIWSRVHGLVSLELGHQFPAFITNPGEVFRREMATLRMHYSREDP